MGREEEILRIANEAWLGLGDTSKLHIDNPLFNRSEADIERPDLHTLRLMRNPDYFSFTVKSLFNINLIPMQSAILKELWLRNFPMLIMSRGAGKSWLLAVYCMLRLVLVPGSKIVIVGAAFRQAKVIFEYMEAIWYGAPVLRDIMHYDQEKAGPRRDIDRCTMSMNGGWAVAIPLGNGDKIRGLRAHVVIADEFSVINPEIYETVVAGFGAVSSAPYANVKNAAKRKAMKEMKVWTPEMEETYKGRRSNQAILAGTCDYAFENFAKYWQKYCKIIRSRGDIEKLKQAFGVDDIDIENMDWKDYSVMRVPFELIPEGFMDAKTVGRAKLTNHSGIYLKEYGACLIPGTKITTTRGLINIEDIEVGDLVLTHKGRFKPVSKCLSRYYNGNINNYKTFGYNQNVKVTPEHPFWYGNNIFETLRNNNTQLVNLQELNNRTNLNIENICNNYLETLDGNFIYPLWGTSKIDILGQRVIRNSNLSRTELAKKYKVKYSSIVQMQTTTRKPKVSIKKNISLDYYFGLIIGYYAAEGSISSNGKQLSFALDEHKDTNFQNQLCDAIYRVFGLNAKRYIKQKNTMEIAINSRLVTSIIKYICPGIANTKLINHDILFSNSNFLKGVIEGYWNGDGHIGIETRHASACSVSDGLLNQIRLALSYFGIHGSFKHRNKSEEYQQQAYLLNVSGDEFISFMKIIYNKNVTRLRNSQIKSDNESVLWPIIQKTTEDYCGFVYNLEVEQDNSYSLLNATVHNCFPNDSDGFFKMSLINSCTVSEQTPIHINGKPIWFNGGVKGHPNLRYVYGIDPASENDNFAIVVLELHQDHTRVVYSWTTTRSKFTKSKNLGHEHEATFFNYCARKVRDLMKVFPCARIGIDSQGGGYVLEEALHDPDKLEQNEHLLWQVIEEGKDKPTDGKQGLHILELIQFANADWVAVANNGLKKDMEDKVLLFPSLNSIDLALAIESDKLASDKGERANYSDLLEECVLEIEELKRELSTIIHTKTELSNRDRWTTPEIKEANGKKGRMRKDRYSALLIANMLARQIHRAEEKVSFDVVGGFAQQQDTRKRDKNAKMYNGPDWFSQANDASKFYGQVFRR